DGAPLGRFATPLSPLQQVGFRGGDRMAVVDDVVIRKRGDAAALQPVASVYETFDAPSPWRRGLACVLGVVLANAAVLVFLLSRAGARPRATLLGATLANGTLAVMAATLLAFILM